jgi:hypothetical protein
MEKELKKSKIVFFSSGPPVGRVKVLMLRAPLWSQSTCQLAPCTPHSLSLSPPLTPWSRESATPSHGASHTCQAPVSQITIVPLLAHVRAAKNPASPRRDKALAPTVRPHLLTLCTLAPLLERATNSRVHVAYRAPRHTIGRRCGVVHAPS